MGVKACDRKGCENIMCDRYSPEYGYICYDCYAELLSSDETDIERFMSNPRPNLDLADVDDREAALNSIFALD